MTKTRPLLLVGALCVATLSLGACSDKDDKGGNRPAQVGYVVVQQKAVPVTATLGGRTVAFETSEVRPQVNGVIRRVAKRNRGWVRLVDPSALLCDADGRAKTETPTGLALREDGAHFTSASAVWFWNTWLAGQVGAAFDRPPGALPPNSAMAVAPTAPPAASGG